MSQRIFSLQYFKHTLKYIQLLLRQNKSWFSGTMSTEPVLGCIQIQVPLIQMF